MRTIEIFGKPFRVDSQSEDNRRIASLGDKSYELVSFPGLWEMDQDTLRRELPTKIEKCFIKNPDCLDTVKTDLPVVTLDSVCARDRLAPPGANPDGTTIGVRRVISASPIDNLEAIAHLLAIIKEVFRSGRDKPSPYDPSRFMDGIEAFRATFDGGRILYFRDLVATAPQTATFVERGSLKAWEDFRTVRAGGRLYDLQNRPRASACLRLLYERKAFDESSALDFDTQIDPYIKLGKTRTNRIQDYFGRDYYSAYKALVRAAGRTGRYYLNAQ